MGVEHGIEAAVFGGMNLTIHNSDNDDYVKYGIWEHRAKGLDRMPRAPVIIAGPTASGKSALASRIAQRDGGVVINADALQVYDCWQVLTARPDAREMELAPHRLYGHVGRGDRYSVGAWLRDLAPILDELARTDQRAVIVGGTGLYLSALTDGLADIPEISAEVRMISDAALRARRLDSLREDLERDDPETFARIDRANPVRIQRAWDVLKSTGRGLADWHRTTPPPLLSAESCARIVVNPQKPVLNANINHRFEKMIETGALEECAAFHASGGDLMAPSGRALGAAELIDYLEGRMSLDTAITRATTATRQFAKRQRSWFRGRMADWTWVDPLEGDALASVAVD